MSSKNTNQPPKKETELADAEYDRKWDQEVTLIPNRKANDPRFGEIHIFKKKNSNDIVFSKEKMSSSKQQAGKDIRELKSRLALNTPNVQKILGYSTSTRKELCSTSYYTQGFYEFPKSDLHKESTQRIQNGQSFTESELSGIASQALNGLNNLHSQNITHGDIRPQYIGLSKENNEAIILDRLADPSPIEKVQASHIIGGKNQLYLSPEMYKKIQGKDNSSKYDPFKNDVYALGLSILEVGNGKSIKDIYNTNGTVDQAKLDAHVNTFSQKYKGEYLNSLVRTSLAKDQSSRLTSGELSGKLGSWKETRVFSQTEPVNQTTVTKTEASTVQKSEPSSFGNFSSNLGPEVQSTTHVMNNQTVVNNVQTTPSFLKPASAKETYYFESNNQQNSWQNPQQSQHLIQSEAPRQDQSTTLNNSQSYSWANPQYTSQVQTQVKTQPHEYATPFEYSNSLGSNQGYQTYSQQHVQVQQAPVRTEYISSQHNVRTYNQPPVSNEVVRKYSQAPVITEYVSNQPQHSTVYTQAPVRTEYVTSQPQYITSYSQAPILTTEYVNHPQYTTVHSQAPVRTEYVTSQATPPVYTQLLSQNDLPQNNVVTTVTHQPSVITSNQVHYTTPFSGSEVKKSVVFSNAVIQPSTYISNSQRNVSQSNVDRWVTGGSQHVVSQSERIVNSHDNNWSQSNSRIVQKGNTEGRKSVTFVNHEGVSNELNANNVIRTEVVKSSWSQPQESSEHKSVISYDEFLKLKQMNPSISMKETTVFTSQLSNSPVFIPQHAQSYDHHGATTPTFVNGKETDLDWNNHQEQLKQLHQQNQEQNQTVAYSTHYNDHNDQNNVQTFGSFAQPSTHYIQSYQEHQTQGVEDQDDYDNNHQTQYQEIHQIAEQYNNNDQHNYQNSGSQWSNGNHVSQNYSTQVQSNEHYANPSDIKVKRYRIENGNRIEISPSSF